MRVQGQIDFTITERSDDRVLAEMPIIDGIKNPFGTVHAGAILWFADVAATVLAMSSTAASEGMKGFPLAISLNANLLGNQKEGTFKASSSFVKQGKTVSVVRTVVTGADGKQIADVTTTSSPNDCAGARRVKCCPNLRSSAAPSASHRCRPLGSSIRPHETAPSQRERRGCDQRIDQVAQSQAHGFSVR